MVRELPESMKKYVIDYKRLTESQEKEFLDMLFTEKDFGEDCSTFQRMSVRAQRFVVNAAIPRVHPSIRDLVRMRDLMAFFCKNDEDILCKCRDKTWGSFIMSIAINYYFRLPTNFRGDALSASYSYPRLSDEDLRKKFVDMFQQEMNQTLAPIEDFEV